MPTNFQLRVEKYFGDVLAAEYMPTTTQLTDILTAGGADIVNKIPAKLLEFMATETAITGTKKAVASIADNGSGQARLTSVAHGFGNGDIITNDSFTNTAYNGTFIVYGVTTDTYDIYATYTATGTGDSYKSIGVTNITAKILEVLRFSTANRKNYRCRRSDLRFRDDLVNSDSFNYASVTDPAYFIKQNKVHAIPVPTDDDTCKLLNIVHPAILYTSDETTTDPPIDRMPGGLIDLIVLYAVIQIYYRQKGYFETKFIDELQAITTSGYLASFEGALPTYTDPAHPSISLLVLAMMTALPSLSLSSSTDAWPTFSETLALPVLVLPDMEDLPTYVSPVIETAIGTLSITNKTLTMPGGIVLPTLALTSAPVFSNLVLPVAPTKTLAYTSISEIVLPTVTETLPTFSLPVSPVDMTDFNTHMTNEDIELAQTSLQKQIALTNDFQANVQKELSRFNSNIEKYRSALQEISQTVQSKVNANTTKMQDNRNNLEEQISQYSNDIQKWQIEINSTVQEWLAEEVQFKLNKWQAQVQSELGEFNGKVQAELGRFRESVNAIISEFKAEMDADVAEWDTQKKVDLAKLEADTRATLGEYQAGVNAVISKFQARVTAEIQSFSAKVGSIIQEYNAKISSYSAKMQAYLGELNALRNSEIQEFAQKASIYIQEYSSKNTALISEFNANVQQELGEYSGLVQGEASEFQSGLGKARLYLEEAGVRLQTMGAYLQKSVSSIQDAMLLEKKYDEQIKQFIGV